MKFNVIRKFSARVRDWLFDCFVGVDGVNDVHAGTFHLNNGGRNVNIIF